MSLCGKQKKKKKKKRAYAAAFICVDVPGIPLIVADRAVLFPPRTRISSFGSANSVDLNDFTVYLGEQRLGKLTVSTLSGKVQ